MKITRLLLASAFLLSGSSLIIADNEWQAAQWATAIELGQTAKIQKMINENKNIVNQSIESITGVTALMQAAEDGDVALVKLLLDNGATVSLADRSGRDIEYYINRAPANKKQEIRNLISAAKTKSLEEGWEAIEEEEVEEGWEKI